MKLKEPVITQDEMSAAVDEAKRDFLTQCGQMPTGALSMEGWAEKLGLGMTTMRIRMKKAVADGTYERLITNSMDQRGQPYKLPVYRKVKQVPNAKPMDRIRRSIL